MKKLVPHLVTLIIFATTTTLGVWQVQRLQWKTNLLDQIEIQLAKTPVDIQEFQGVNNDEYRLIRATGKFDHEKEIRVINKTYNGKAGFHIITPMTLSNGEEVIINRGFVAYEKEYTQPQGETSIVGIARKAQIPNWLTLENDPQNDMWFFMELPLISQELDVQERDYYLDRIAYEDDNSKDFPLPLPKKIKMHNEHMQYAITWFSLSIILLIMYYFRFWKNNGAK